MKKVLLCCNAGMSTTLLLHKIKKRLQDKNIELDLDVIPINELKLDQKQADVLLLGPQLGFKKEEIKKELNIPIEVLAPEVYASMDVDAVFEQIQKLLKV